MSSWYLATLFHLLHIILQATILTQHTSKIFKVLCPLHFLYSDTLQAVVMFLSHAIMLLFHTSTSSFLFSYTFPNSFPRFCNFFSLSWKCTASSAYSSVLSNCPNYWSNKELRLNQYSVQLTCWTIWCLAWSTKSTIILSHGTDCRS